MATSKAYQWFKNGDHPDDGVGKRLFDPISGKPYTKLEGEVVRFFRRPEPEFGGSVEHSCGYTYHYHGWIDYGDEGQIVCPGNWIYSDDRHNYYAKDSNEG